MFDLFLALMLFVFGRNGGVTALRPAPMPAPSISIGPADARTIPDPLPYTLPCAGSEDDVFVITCEEFGAHR